MSGLSTSFELLDERIRHFIWSEGWEALRDAQEAAIPLIVPGDTDVIIAAATAAGKTEAAFLPALTNLLQYNELGLIIYVSPLKALINDQFCRLQRLCNQLEIPVWPWHGDISRSVKTRFAARRAGVLLITPESLEAILCSRGTATASVFERSMYFILDEMHAFIGTERGKQLQSLLHRIERAIGREVPRVGLSATLGNMTLAAEFLRPGAGGRVSLVESRSAATELRILVKGYEEPMTIRFPKGDDEQQELTTPRLIASHLFSSLRGSNNLVFPNSRRDVERYTYFLNELCQEARLPNEFWPHHGNLSKEIRAETEMALKQKVCPATAVCTNTLELGIDIGAVKSVAQIGRPPSVASLRQRLGRSGRRTGEPAILRGYCIEFPIGSSRSLANALRLETVETVAIVSLLLEGWFEPPQARGYHYSTLVQQILSVIAQKGGATIGELYELLCGGRSPFSTVCKTAFMELVRQLGKKDLLIQDSSGVLLHGSRGEKFVNHYSFYAAFASDEEFRVIAREKTLGTMPISQTLTEGQRILFGGKTWVVEGIDESCKAIYVRSAKGGVPPLFSGGVGRTHTKVRQRTRQILESAEYPKFLDSVASRFLAEARQQYELLNLADTVVLDQGNEVQLLTWLGDAANEAIACMLGFRGYLASPGGPGVEVRKCDSSAEGILAVLVDMASEELPPVDALLANATNLQREKWDWALPEGLLRKNYAGLYMDFEEGVAWAKTLAKN